MCIFENFDNGRNAFCHILWQIIYIALTLAVYCVKDRTEGLCIERVNVFDSEGRFQEYTQWVNPN